MKVKVEDSGPCRKTLFVELPSETVKTEYEKIAQEFAAVAAVPGYRKGKAPKLLVERHYKKNIMDEVKDGLIFRSYRDALKEKQLNPVAVLDLSDVSVEHGKPMSYKVVLDVPPQFKLPKYKKIHVKPQKIDVSDEMVQQQFDLLRERLAEYKVTEENPLRKGDLAQIDYAGFSEGEPLEVPDKTASWLAKGRDFWVTLNENAFLPGLSDALESMKTGDEKEIQVVFPSDFQHAALAGKTAMFRVAVKQVREKILPEINEDFFRKMDVESESALRTKIKEMLEAEMSRGERERLKSEIIKTLLKDTSLDLPASVVQDETRSMLSSLVRENVRRGVPREKLEEKKDQLFDHAAKSAEEKVKLGYILHRIAEEEKIEVEQPEIDKAIQDAAVHWGVDADTARKELEKRKAIDAVRNDILADKTLDFLLENASSADEEGLFSRIVKGRKKN